MTVGFMAVGDTFHEKWREKKKKEKKGNDCLPFFFFFLNQESASGNGFISLSM